jgi:putative ABC transport system ATP-binding protein
MVLHPSITTAPRPPYQLQVSNVSKTYRLGGLDVVALREIDLTIQQGDFIVIFGPSGCGKSTLLNLLGGLDHPTSGQISFEGRRLDLANEAELTHYRRKQVGFIFQFFNLLPSLNALDNVALSLLARGATRKEARQKATACLEGVDLSHRKNHKPAELSGGEQQRVAIARAIVGEPSLVLADEPTGDLDAVSTETVMKLICRLNQEMGMTFIIATHNDRLRQFSDRVFELYDGRLMRS